MTTLRIDCEIAKTSDDLGIVYGFAIVCSVDDRPYLDLQKDHIPEQTMVEAGLDFFEKCRVSGDSHQGEDGMVPFGFPLTREIAKALGIETSRTGLLIGMRPSAEVYAKFASGEYTQFSIGGEVVEAIEFEEAA